MSQNCENLATKAELRSLEDRIWERFRNYLPTSEKEGIIVASVDRTLGFVPPMVPPVVSTSLNPLQWRIESLENSVTSLFSKLSQLAQELAEERRLNKEQSIIIKHHDQSITFNTDRYNALKYITDELNQLTGKHSSQIASLEAQVLLLQFQIFLATERANLAVEKANEAIDRANKAIVLANDAVLKANQSLIMANLATERANEAIVAIEKLEKILNQKIEEINKRVISLNNSVYVLKVSNTRIENRLTIVEDNIDYNKIKAEITKINASIAKTIADIAKIEEEIKKANLEINKTNQQIKDNERENQIRNDIKEIEIIKQKKQTEQLATALGQTETRALQSENLALENKGEIDRIKRTAGGGSNAAIIATAKKEFSSKLDRQLLDFSVKVSSQIKAVDKAGEKLILEDKKKNDSKLLKLDQDVDTLETIFTIELEKMREELGLKKESDDLSRKLLEEEIRDLKIRGKAFDNELKAIKQETKVIQSQIIAIGSQIATLNNKSDLTEEDRAKLTSLRATQEELRIKLENLDLKKADTQVIEKSTEDKIKESEKQLRILIREEKQTRSTADQALRQLTKEEISKLNSDNNQRDNRITAIGNQINTVGNNADLSGNPTIEKLTEEDRKQQGQIDSLKGGQIDSLKQKNLEQDRKITALEDNPMDNQKLDRIIRDLTTFGPAISRIDNRVAPSALRQTIAEENCKTLQNPNCTQAIARQTAQQTGNNINNALNRNTAGLAAQNEINRQAIAGVAGQVSTVLQNLAKMQNFLIDKFSKLWNFLGLDKILQVLNFILNLHNAAMLSRNLATTLTETTGNVLSALGIKDPEGNPIDIGSKLGSQVDQFLEGLIGADNWEGTKDTWKKANRILSAATQLKDNISSFRSVVGESMEVLGGWLAQGFNGLKEEGLVSEDRYDWMPESPQFRNHFSRANQIIENLTEATESINQIASQVIESQELISEINTNWNTLKTELNAGKTDKTDKELGKDADSSTTSEIDNTSLTQAVTTED